tara:strand:- start:678 stop:959 length:282 start_codon:yes stop_codon:yes gene_type:complete
VINTKETKHPKKPSKANILFKLKKDKNEYTEPDGLKAMMYVEAMMNDGIARGSGISTCKSGFNMIFVLAISQAKNTPKNNEVAVTAIPSVIVL